MSGSQQSPLVLSFCGSGVFLVAALLFFQNCSAPSAVKGGGNNGPAGTESCLSVAFPAPAVVAQTCPSGVLDPASLLTSSEVVFSGECVLSGDIRLAGSQKLIFRDATVFLKGNVYLSDTAVLAIKDSTFNLANDLPFQYHVAASGSSIFDIRQSTMMTNSGVNTGLSLTSSFGATQDATVRFDEVILNSELSWLLLSLNGRATLETQNTNGIPNEVYPQDQSTIRACGEKTGLGIWLDFKDGQKADLSSLPDPLNLFTFSFGRNQSQLTNVGYQVDITNARAGFNIASHSGSEVTVVNNDTPITIGYYIEDSTTPVTLNNLPNGPGSRHTLTLTDQGRLVGLEDALFTPMGWQIYVRDSSGLVQVNNSKVNEFVIFEDGEANADHTDFYWAVLGINGPNSELNVTNSTVKSQLIMNKSNSVIRIENSTIYGSVVQADDESRSFLLNNKLQANIDNPYAGIGENVRFKTTGNGAIVVMGVNEILGTVKKGATVNLLGDVQVTSLDVASQPTFFDVVVTNSSDVEVFRQRFTSFGIQIPLGSLNTTSAQWTPGPYVIRVDVTYSGSELRVGRALQLVP